MNRRRPEILERPVPLEGDGEEAARQQVVVRRRLSGRRLDKYLHSRYPRMSRTLIQRLIKQGAITVNGKPTKASYEPNEGDVVDLVVPPVEPWDVVPEEIPLKVIYEDDHLLVLNKQTGIICHPARAGQTGTLANGLAYYANTLSHGEDPFRPGIVHRLDKNTTGVMLVAKSDEAHWRMSMQFEKRTVRKTYLGILEGEPELDEDVIDKPLSAHPRLKDRYVVPGLERGREKFKEAITRYRIVERFRGFALAELSPKTGRTHQLRVHMLHIGHPMFGDVQYGGHPYSEFDLCGEGSTEALIGHQSLHAWRIRFVHPIEEKSVEFEAPPPANILRVLAFLREHRAM